LAAIFVVSHLWSSCVDRSSPLQCAVHLEKQGVIPEKTARFWMAELSSGLEYLHRMRIMHRDIKPDNIMLDQEGHAHLTDFNVAIHYSSQRLHTSIGGSMAYMAPEMLATRPSSSSRTGTKPVGYTWCVDWWSLGVTAYELLLGHRPFDAKSSDAMKDAILRDEIKWQGVPGRATPSVSSDGRNFVRSVRGFLRISILLLTIVL
jgi:serine/threonine kinase 32